MSDRRRVDNGLAANVDGYLAGNRHLRSGGRLDVSYRHLYYRETSDRVRPHYKPVIRRRCARRHVYPLADRAIVWHVWPHKRDLDCSGCSNGRNRRIHLTHAQDIIWLPTNLNSLIEYSTLGGTTG